MAVPYTFGSATTSIPLSQLDSNFATGITLGNTSIQLGNTVTTLNNMTLPNATVASGNISASILTSGTVPSARQPTGSVLQVVSTTITSFFSTTSTSFTDITGLNVSITPTSSSSKILVLVTGSVGSTSSAISQYNLVRTSTSIYIGDARGSSTRSSAATASVSTDKATSIVINFLDSPATTSATTYKLQMLSENAIFAACIGGSSGSGGAYAGSTPSTITVMEIAA